MNSGKGIGGNGEIMVREDLMLCWMKQRGNNSGRVCVRDDLTLMKKLCFIVRVFWSFHKCFNFSIQKTRRSNERETFDQVQLLKCGKKIVELA